MGWRFIGGNREDLTKGRKISIKGIDFWAEVC